MNRNRSVRVCCPAKINKFLRILKKRDDGYHELLTIYQAIDLWDEIRVEEAPDLSLFCDAPGIPTDDSNLVLRAARTLAERTGITDRGARFLLTKNIPAGGGMGGGSSDAAGTLVALNHLWGLGMDRDDLAGIAASIGSDVPFFLYGGTAVGSGRGEIIDPLPFGGEVLLILGSPPFGIDTREVYDKVVSRLTLPMNSVSLSRLLTVKVPGGKDFGAAVNDLEAVVFDGWPQLRAFRDALVGRGARMALMSGSGSSVFGVFNDEQTRSDALRELRSQFGSWGLMRTRTIQEAAHLKSET